MLDESGNTEAKISVDGGITSDTAKLVWQSGASVVVAGNSVYGAPDINKAVADLKAAGTGKTKFSGEAGHSEITQTAKQR